MIEGAASSVIEEAVSSETEIPEVEVVLTIRGAMISSASMVKVVTLVVVSRVEVSSVVSLTIDRMTSSSQKGESSSGHNDCQAIAKTISYCIDRMCFDIVGFLDD